MPAHSLLITGFGPFPGVPDNPTTALVDGLAGAGDTLVLPTRWDACAQVAELAAQYDAVLMFGVATRGRHVRYERRAAAAASRLADHAGALPGVAPHRSRHSAYNVPALVRAARLAGFPVRLSNSAGTYICNASYAAALGAMPFALFVHVPMPTRRGPTSLPALIDHGRWLAAYVRLATPRRIGGARPTVPATHLAPVTRHL